MSKINVNKKRILHVGKTSFMLACLVTPLMSTSLQVFALDKEYDNTEKLTLPSSKSLSNDFNIEGQQPVKATTKQSQEESQRGFAENNNALTTPNSSSNTIEESDDTTRSAALADKTVFIPDINLKQDILKSLSMSADADLTEEDMARLINLRLTSSQLYSLSGLEYATNLSTIYKNGATNITDFSPLEQLTTLTYVDLGSPTLTSDNFPDLTANKGLILLDISESNVDDTVLSKIAQLTSLERLRMDKDSGLTTIAPLKGLPNLRSLSIQFCGITDFTVINDFPTLNDLSAFGQNTGRNSSSTIIDRTTLKYNEDEQSVYIPFSMMPDRMVNFDGYIPPFSTSNSASNTYLDFNGTQLAASRLQIDDNGITINSVTPEEYQEIKTVKYNARLDNLAGTYATPADYHFYSITSGTYRHQFDVVDARVPGAPVTVNYQDENGQELAPSVVLADDAGGIYQSEQLDIPDYTFKEVQGNPTGQFTDQPQTVTYVYTKNPAVVGDVTAEYVDTTGHSISDKVVQSGNVGDAYKTEQKSIDGYTFKEVQGNPTGEFTAQAQTVTYVYTKNPAVVGDVTVEYVDTTGHSISDKVVQSGNVGDAYKTEQKSIDGYTFKEVQGNPTGQFTDQAQTVTYVYTKNPAVVGDVTAEYVDTTGHSISDKVVQSGNVGDAYKTEQKSIDGYTFKEVQGNPTGEFTDQPQTVTYVYTKDDVKPSNQKPEDGGDSPSLDGMTSPVVTDATDPIVHSISSSELPKTGESEGISFIGSLLGLVLLAMGSVLSVLHSKKSK